MVERDEEGDEAPVEGVTVKLDGRRVWKMGDTDDTGVVCFDEGLKTGYYTAKVDLPNGYEYCGKHSSHKCFRLGYCESEELKICIRKKGSAPPSNDQKRYHKKWWGERDDD